MCWRRTPTKALIADTKLARNISHTLAYKLREALHFHVGDNLVISLHGLVPHIRAIFVTKVQSKEDARQLILIQLPQTHHHVKCEARIVLKAKLILSQTLVHIHTYCLN